MEPEIQNYLSELKADIKEKYNIKVEALIKDFESIKDTNVADIFDIIDNQIVLKNGITKLSDLPPEITKNIKSIKNTTNGIAIEMYCRDAALRDLAKIAGLFKDDVTLTVGTFEDYLKAKKAINETNA
jgi:uncharacterized protein YfbU (UPF0304 family)